MCTFTAPEDEPQRGTVIQTDDDGRIATMPTDRGSRIISRDEYSRLNTDQGRGNEINDIRGNKEQGFITPVAVDPEKLFSQVREVFGSGQSEAQGGIGNLNERAAEYMQPFQDTGQITRYNAFPNIGVGSLAHLATEPLMGEPDIIGSEEGTGFNFDPDRSTLLGMPQGIMENRPASMPPADPYGRNRELQIQRNIFGDTKDRFVRNPETGKLVRVDKPLSYPEIMRRKFQQPAQNMYYPQERGQAAMFSDGTSLGDAKKEIEVSKEGDTKNFSPLEQAMLIYRNPIGKFLNYETDNKGMLTIKGLADMEADKQKSEAFYREGQRHRNLDRDRAMAAQMQSSGISPCEEGFKYNPLTKACEPARQTTGESELGTQFSWNKATEPDWSNYGRVGGEYSFFGEMPGVASPNVRTLNMGGGLSSLPRARQGETTGKIKEDAEGPFMMSGSEYVLPTEQIIEVGNGDYDRGINALDSQRYKALRKYKDRVDHLKV